MTMLVVLGLVMAACGGSTNTAPTVTPAPMPTRAQAMPTATASSASPIASPAGSPVASPAALTASASTLTRAEFKEQLLATYPMEAPAKTGGDVVFGSPDDISTTNPLLASDSTSINILSQVFETLLG
ncbi:MAG TPA: hypothetical protein PK691_04635, partial [Thermomicrobiales bacterium]|nr:hypothetical protein [Thermomicrobiales bacterium]